MDDHLAQRMAELKILRAQAESPAHQEWLLEESLASSYFGVIPSCLSCRSDNLMLKAKSGNKIRLAAIDSIVLTADGGIAFIPRGGLPASGKGLQLLCLNCGDSGDQAGVILDEEISSN
jgi:hypothetical protein